MLGNDAGLNFRESEWRWGCGQEGLAAVGVEGRIDRTAGAGPLRGEL
jgi:hypothetical protein